MMIVDPYRFASGPVGDVTIAVQDFASRTTTGSQSYTSTTITGLTPKSALVICSIHTSTNDPGETPGAIWSIGSMDGTEGSSLTGTSRDNITSTGCSSHNASEELRLRNNADGTELVATGSLVSEGVSFNYTTVGATARRLFFVAFAGPDMLSEQGNFSLGTGTSAIDVTGPGFEPDAVIAFGSGFAFNNSNSPMGLSLGIATNDGTQRSVIWRETNVLASGNRPFQTLQTDAIGGLASDSTGALIYKLTAGSFDASGFSVTPSASATNGALSYLALNFGGRRFKLVDFTTPTATGNSTITGAGFTPQFALAILTNLEATDSFPGSSDDNQGGLSICAIGSDEQWALSLRINSGSDPSDTASQISNAAIMGASATDCDAILSTFVDWTSDGVTVNYTAVQGTGKKGFILFVE